MNQSPDTTGTTPLAMICPSCGYDLRATTGERCSECGWTIDREALKHSGFPWAHRRSIGRIRAYLKTVWQVTIGSKSLRDEMARPQDAKDGRSFQWVTGTLAALVFLIFFGAAVWAEGGLGFLAVPPPMDIQTAKIAGAPFGAVQDWVMPWCAGATLLPVIPICLILLSFYLAGAQRRLFSGKQFPEDYRQRALVIGSYLSAPLVFCVFVMMLIGGGALIGRTWGPAAESGTITLSLILTGEILAIFSLVLSWYQTVRWRANIRHQGVGDMALGTVQLIGLWLAGVVVLIGFLPWAIGLLWIVLDSLR